MTQDERVACLALALLLCSPVAALLSQTIAVGFGRGDSVVLALPAGFASIHQTGLFSTNLKLDVEARESGGVVEVRNPGDSTWRRDWRFEGFPSRVRYYVSNLKTVSRQGAEERFIEVSLRAFAGLTYRLYAPASQPQVIRTLVAPVGGADSIRRIAYDSLGARFFTGPLQAFSSSERLLLLTFADIKANGTLIGSETYKGVTYLTIVLPGDGSTWNDLRVTRTERIGRVISDQLALLKAFARVAVPHTVIGGLKLEQRSTHGTAPYYIDVKNDRVEAYFPLDAMLKFVDADITSQQLVNQSIILVNGDRIEVDLRAQ